MKCPNCKTEFRSGNRCPKCRIDTALFKRTIRISNSHYNRGLERVKIQDLSGAIIELQKSVEYNKANVNARNLLGLIYFEIGRIGDAVANWVLSASYVKSDNLASYYIDTIQKNSKAAEKINEAVISYNQALSYLEQESEDLAVIQLKRALDLNPKFIDAMNLLALCYLTKNDREKARQLVEKVLDADTGNVIAHKYYLEVFGRLWSDKQPLKQSGSRFDMSKLDSPESALMTKKSYSSLVNISAKNEKNFRNNFHIPEIITFIVGVVSAIAVFYILVLPSKIEKLEADLISVNELMRTNEDSMNEAIQRKNGEIRDLTQENNDLKSRIAGLENEKSELQRIQRVGQVEAVFEAGNLEETIALLSDINPVGLPTDVLERYENVKIEAYARYARQMYDEGVINYNAGLLDEARNEFELCLKYVGDELGIVDQALYMLGRMADEEGNTETTIMYYQRIVDEYPNSARISTVTSRLNELQQ